MRAIESRRNQRIGVPRGEAAFPNGRIGREELAARGRGVRKSGNGDYQPQLAGEADGSA